MFVSVIYLLPIFNFVSSWWKIYETKVISYLVNWIPSGFETIVDGCGWIMRLLRSIGCKLLCWIMEIVHDTELNVDCAFLWSFYKQNCRTNFCYINHINYQITHCSFCIVPSFSALKFNWPEIIIICFSAITLSDFSMSGRKCLNITQLAFYFSANIIREAFFVQRNKKGNWWVQHNCL